MRNKTVVYNDQQNKAPAVKSKGSAIPHMGESMSRAQAHFDGRFIELRTSAETYEYNIWAWLKTFFTKYKVNFCLPSPAAKAFANWGN